MKTGLLVFAFIAGHFIIHAQSVEDLRIEQDGDKANIYWKIDQSTRDQTFTIIISCKTDTREKFELKSVSGDVGVNIPGGKSEYMAVWDVLKDIDELGEAEFFVKIILNKEISLPVVKKDKPYNFFAAYSGALKNPFGIQLGYLKHWGGLITATTDGKEYYSVTFGLARQIYAGEKSKLYPYLTGGYGNWGEDNEPSTAGPIPKGPEFGIGLIRVSKRIVASVGVLLLKDELNVVPDKPVILDLTYSVGICF